MAAFEFVLCPQKVDIDPVFTFRFVPMTVAA